MTEKERRPPIAARRSHGHDQRLRKPKPQATWHLGCTELRNFNFSAQAHRSLCSLPRRHRHGPILPRTRTVRPVANCFGIGIYRTQELALGRVPLYAPLSFPTTLADGGSINDCTTFTGIARNLNAPRKSSRGNAYYRPSDTINEGPARFIGDCRPTPVK